MLYSSVLMTLATLLLIISSDVITSSFLKSSITNSERFLATTVIAITHIISILLVCGTLFHGLNYMTVSLSSIAISVLIYFLVKNFCSTRAPSLKLLIGNYRNIFSRIVKYLFSEKSLLPFVFILSAIYFWRSIIAFFFPIYDYDGLWYHVVVVAKWIQEQKIYPIYDNLWTLAYPKNGELLYLWIALFTHSSAFIKTISILSTFLCAFVAFCLIRLISKNKFLNISVFLSTLFLPALIVTVGISYVDTLQTAFFMISIFFFLKIYMEKIDHFKKFPNIERKLYYTPEKIFLHIVYILSLAFMAGIKSVGLGYAFGLISLSIILEIIIMHKASKKLLKDERHHLVVNNLYYFSIFFFIFLVFASYWYLTNFFVLKNPIFPYSLLKIYQSYVNEIFNTQIPPLMYQYHKIPMLWPLLSWLVDLKPSMQAYDTRPGGMGVNFILFYLPSIIIVIILLLFKKKFNKKIKTFLWLLLLPTFFAFLISPLKWWTRFTLFLPITGIICFAFIIQYFFSNRKLLFKLSFIFILSVASLYSVVDSYLTSSTYSFLSILPKGRTTLRSLWFGIHHYTYGPYSNYRNLPKIKQGNTMVFISDDQDIYYPYIGKDFKNKAVTIRYSYINDIDTLYALIKSAGGDYFAIQPYYNNYDNNYPLQIRSDNFIIGSGYILSNENIYQLRNIYQQVSNDTAQFQFIGMVGTHYIFKVL